MNLSETLEDLVAEYGGRVDGGNHVGGDADIESVKVS
jgi:hypothetical protein